MTTRRIPMAAVLYGDIEATPPAMWRELLPGLMVAAIGTCAAGFLSDHYGVPLTLMALLIGLAEQFGLAYAPTYSVVFTFVIMVVALAFKPKGLMA